ncbi:prephenate dehydratase [Bordetella trematum]|uniref:prephenate dehydratase n=1 Tax=Bordetella trematum TaxID=123899 RepID=UPI003F51D24D
MPRREIAPLGGNMKRTLLSAMAGLSMYASPITPAAAGQIAYLGPAGSWTHQACLDLFGPDNLVPLSRDELFARYQSGEIEQACVPVTTSVVGVTPYLDAVLDMPNTLVVAEYPKRLGYSLLARPGTKLADIKEVLAHPVAFEEVQPWIDKQMPAVKRREAASAGAAAKAVAESDGHDKASFGPKVGASVYSLVPLIDGIEEGPHNVTRWWVLGRKLRAPSGNDKTSLLVETSDDRFSGVLRALLNGGVPVLTIYERPSKKTLDTHRYLIEVAGHAKQEPLASVLQDSPDFRVLGSYPRR